MYNKLIFLFVIEEIIQRRQATIPKHKSKANKQHNTDDYTNFLGHTQIQAHAVCQVVKRESHSMRFSGPACCPRWIRPLVECDCGKAEEKNEKKAIRD